MSFILDALRKSEHERQRSSTPGLSHVPLAAPRRELPRWTLIVIGTLGAAVLVLGGAWWQSTRAPRDNLPVARTEAPRQSPVATPLPVPPIQRPATRSLSQTTEPESLPATSPPRNAPVATAPLATAAASPTTNDPALPSATALAAQGVALPMLRLELHAYAERPSDRFVFINGRKYVEGDRLADGPELVSIVPSGAVLRYSGQRFMLTAE